MVEAEFKPSAEVIAHSEWPRGMVELITMELEYHRFVHSEFMTHRNFSRNASSSRAVPVSTMLGLVGDKKVAPVYWGMNRQGMQATEEAQGEVKSSLSAIWNAGRDAAVLMAEKLHSLGAHKQIVNRVLEPYSTIKVVATGTRQTWEDFLRLRTHKDAQPEIRALALEVKKALEGSHSTLLKEDEWHMPYFREGFWGEDSEASFKEASLISVSCCAQVSYRKLDDDLEKAEKIFYRLNMDPASEDPMHASPAEHQATYRYSFLQGLEGNLGSGFVQLRKLLEFGITLDEVYE